ncbi:MAG: AAA family ATPase [Coleofasciculaceae cyanobacterium SM2_1_6]|nr:AAA family ATPase [Coleofasciculaceae cyanobacterium SM2_1_6]
MDKSNQNNNHLPLGQIIGYQIIEAVYLGSRTSVYRAIRTYDQLPVVIKLLRNEYPTFSELVQFRNQYTIAKNINSPLIIQTYSLEPYQNGYALVMEDFGGISLKEWAELECSQTGVRIRKQSLQEFLAVAIALCDALDILYQERIIHKDIKPANILINPETKQIKLIDFSIASLLPRETQEIKNANALEGTLAYISPEQTGRMNRGIDYRTDFYSLGITFYELLTGELPFLANDPMELIHAHIAKLAPLIYEINPEIPLVLSAIVMKLMAKNAEDRYQSALGLKFDLEKCLTQLQETGEMQEFVIGERDESDRFIIPDKLYGRQAEVETLLDAFERVSQGSTELMLVAGFSGIGKTAVVNEVHKPIVKQRGYFIKGKFDQFQRNIPFSAFVQAFRDLIGQLLSESDAQLETWKMKIQGALGDNAQVMIEVIPELVLILGSQPPAAELSGMAAQNRFNLLFQKFFRVFTTQDHPVVLFIDDLQWADSASLNLMQLLLGDQETKYLLFLGAYRDNEVSPVHPFMLTLGELQKLEVQINRINLSPLSRKSINQLVADTLSCSTDLAMPLTELVMTTAKGNPFFSTQLLKSLYEEKLIRFDRQERYWLWDRTAILTLTLPEDVVEFMALQLQKLSPPTQNVLKLAACIGAEFDLATLAIISEQTEVEVSVALWEALQEELILPLNQVYRFFQDGAEILTLPQSVDVPYHFLHDRVQQAAYSLIPDNHKQYIHLKIGQLLLQNLPPEEKQEHIFDLVSQLNMGRDAISTTEEKQELAQLNLEAGQKAKLSAAYQLARDYCAIGISLLSENTWHENYTLIYDLHRHGSEAAYLFGDFDRAENLYSVAVFHAQTPIDQATIYRIQMTQYQLQGRNSEAIAIQRQSLQLLGWEVPVKSETIQSNLDAEIAKVQRFLEQQTIESILELPQMDNANIAEMLRILQILFYAAWLDGQPTLALLAVAKITTLSLQFGNGEMSPFGYSCYSLIANSILKDFTTAHRFGEMAIQLCEQFDNADVRGMTNFIFAADVHSWSRPIRAAEPYFENAYRYGMEAGNWLTVSFMMIQSSSDRLTYGKNLDDLYKVAQNYADFLRHVKSLDNLDALIVGVIQPIRHLLGLTKTLFTFDDESFSETQYLQKYKNAPYHLAWLYSVKIRHAYLFDQKNTYSDLIHQLSIIENTIPSHAKVPSSVFYVALMHLGLAETTSEDSERQHHLQSIIDLEEKLQLWVKACPENIFHKCLLIQAEKARLNKQVNLAIELYDQAIHQAQVNEYIYEEALANELAAKFYLNWGKEKVAAGYMQEAYYCYARWGAKAKVYNLETLYPQLLQPILQPSQPSFSILETLTNCSVHSSTPSSSASSISSISHVMDFATILQAAQVLSSTINLDQLLIQFTEIILQNSGADKCVLFLPQQETWLVRAIATTEGTTLYSEPLDEHPYLPVKLIQYVKRTQSMVLVDNLETDLPVIDDYLSQCRPKSLLGLPILNQGKLVGILYLRNRSTSGVFTRDRLTIINFLGTQAAISLENARLYQQSQNYAQQLEQSQLQIVQSEKMSALGNLVAGVAHEMNNPLGFIAASLQQAKPTLDDILEHLKLYQENFPQKSAEIIEHESEIDLEYSLEDLPKVIDSMAMACDRLKNISTSLRTFSRTDRDHKVPFYLYEGIDSTILILKHRLKANDLRPAIEVTTNYGNLPEIECFPGQINQVFMNILANAIDALDESNQGKSFKEIEANPNKITITTTMVDRHMQISIRDNGKGMSEEVKNKVFEHLFTTKEVGKGTGLGLAIAKQIVEEKHQGTITVNSKLGQGTEFMITLPIN